MTVDVVGTPCSESLEQLQEQRRSVSAWACELSDGRTFDCGWNMVANPPCSPGDHVRLNGVAQTSDLTITRIAVWDALGRPTGICCVVK